MPAHRIHAHQHRFAGIRLAIMLTGSLSLAGVLSQAQNPPDPGQPAVAASLNDTLMAKATTLYDSTAKSGLHSFDCQVHPDWNKLMASARKVSSIPPGDPKLQLLNGVKITLHARLAGDSTLSWYVAESAGLPLDPAMQSTLDRTHKGIEQTLLGVIKLWIPLVDGSVAESLGEEDVVISQTADGYTLRTKDKSNSLSEQFDKTLLLKHFVARDSGSTVDIEPAFATTPRGLRVRGFSAHVRSDKAPAKVAQEMRVDFDYQTIGSYQIPSKIDAELVGEATFNFTLDGCAANPQ